MLLPAQTLPKVNDPLLTITLFRSTCSIDKLGEVAAPVVKDHVLLAERKAPVVFLIPVVSVTV